VGDKKDILGLVENYIICSGENPHFTIGLFIYMLGQIHIHTVAGGYIFRWAIRRIFWGWLKITLICSGENPHFTVGLFRSSPT